MKEVQDFDSLLIRLASPEQIRTWSYGEVKKPETINYRTLRPEKEGLFCERIFGTTKEWECYCGKFKSIRYRGVVCDRCGVEVTHFKVRRERMGHIELASPVSHIWYYSTLPSRMGLLLDFSIAALRSILYYEKYVVIEPGNTELELKQLLTEEELYEARERYGVSFTAAMGAEAVRTLLENLDIDALSAELRAVMVEKGAKVDKRLLKRIEIVENFRDSGNKAEWMILDVIPVIPPELRPMVQLDGGRFATSDLNDLYRRVINRNNRLKRLKALNAPDIIIRNEKRMLQESVDALFDNTRKKKVVKGASNRPLKSLSDLLKGKQGRFRQNLLGKRVDYSGRSVIVVGPNLKLHQCGLPTKMALELYKPFIMKKLVDKDVVYNIKKAKTLVEQETPEVWAILDEVVRDHPVLLNRAPTLHRLGIQAFEPILVEGKAIQLHPLVCHAFNADFDGDQMAVHIPLTQAAQIECWTLMLADTNLLNPANGQPVVFPSQDMVLGLYALTKDRVGAKGEGRYYSSASEAMMACDNGYASWNARVHVRMGDEFIKTTPGRVLFNDRLPEGVAFVNETLSDKSIRKLVMRSFKEYGNFITVQLLDALKDIGFESATKMGTTIGMDDILIPGEKKEFVEVANGEIDKIQTQYRDGHITSEERYNRVVEVWGKTNEDLANVMMENLSKDQEGFNNVYMMADSGARGSRNQIRQLAGMRGLMAKPSGDIIELPIRSNFKEGLSVIEFFISTNGARKGLADTALKTADAGYLTRRLVDIAQDVVVNVNDCGTINGIDVIALKDGEEIVESLSDRITGCFTLEQVKHPITGEILVDVNQEVTDELAAEIEDLGIESVRVRTVLTCEAQYGVCMKCYGRNLSTHRPVDIGESVGIIAAQSIGQPGTQLTMRTFHVGGTASTIAEENRIAKRYSLLVRSIHGTSVPLSGGRRLFTRRGYLIVARMLERIDLQKGDKIVAAEGDKVVKGESILVRDGQSLLAEKNAFVVIREDYVLLVAQDEKVDVRNGSTILVQEGAVVGKDESLAVFDPFSEPIIAEVSGFVKFEDIIPGTTLREEINEDTGNIEKKITESSVESLQPRISIVNDEGESLQDYHLPENSYLNTEDGVAVEAGVTLAKMLKESQKTQDITGGLPRVGELFEARHPKDAAILAKISGTVEFEGISKGKRIIDVIDSYGNTIKHAVPMGRLLLVRNGDLIAAADPLCEGPRDPHDILDILGENALQRFLVDEVQEVYRMQGVNINDKHIGVIIRQMMRKVEIINVGDTNFVFGQQVDKYQFRIRNEKVEREGGQAAIARPLLLGITRASLNIDSWISAASFQETTRVLTNAAIAGEVDSLKGVKENVVIGHIIPAGTGMRQYRELKLFTKDTEDLDAHVASLLKQRRLEAEMASTAQVDEEGHDESIVSPDEEV